MQHQQTTRTGTAAPDGLDLTSSPGPGPTRSLALRYAFRWEMEHLFHRCGFDIEALYGDFTRTPFRYGAEHIWLLHL